MNSFGRNFRVTIWGESHGAGIGCSVDGVRAGVELNLDHFSADLERRKSGKKGTTPRKESDTPRVVS
ncbi:MAG: chorismate synthase, partial [Rikenellaceae bacterium]